MECIKDANADNQFIIARDKSDGGIDFAEGKYIITELFL